MNNSEALQILAAATEPADVRGPINRAGFVQCQTALEALSQAAEQAARVPELEKALADAKAALEALKTEN